MGRGTETEDRAYSVISRRESRVSAVHPKSINLYELEEQYSGQDAVGEILHLADGQQLIISEDDPVSLMQGLNSVISVERREDGSLLVSFDDGEKALVDLDDFSVALLSGTDDPDRLLGAIYAALSRVDPDSLSPEAQEKLQALRGAQALYADYKDEENFRKYVQASKDLADEILGDKINIKEVDFEEGLEDFQNNRQTIERNEAFEKVQAALRSEGTVQGVLFGVDDEGNAYGLAPEQIKEREEAAERLGADIPEAKSYPTEVLVDENGDPILDKDGQEQGDPLSARYIMGAQESETLSMVSSLAAAGQRFFIHRGPPGAGKDTFWKEIAALTHRPYELISFGPEAKLEESIGGSDFKAQEVFTERWVEKRDAKTGQILKDDNGEPLMVKEKVVIGSIMVLEEKVGRLGELMQEPSLIVITEPEGSFGEGLVRMNKALGDDFGDPSTRTFYVNSVAGKTHKVHEDCVIVITHNFDNIEGEEQRLRDSTHDRAAMGNIEWGPRPIEEDVYILSGMAKGVLTKLSADGVPWSEGGRGEHQGPLCPGIDQLKIQPEDLTPIAQLMSHVRNDMDQGDGDFVQGIEMRRAISMWETYVQRAYSEGYEKAGEELAKGLLTLFDATESTHQERLDMAKAHIRDTVEGLVPLGMRIAEITNRMREQLNIQEVNKVF